MRGIVLLLGVGTLSKHPNIQTSIKHGSGATIERDPSESDDESSKSLIMARPSPSPTTSRHPDEDVAEGRVGEWCSHPHPISI
jgi:hypothetical protein